MNVRLTKAQKIKILNSRDISKIMQQILLRENKISRNQQHFWIVGLDNKNTILFIELVSLGGTNAVIVKPREIFRMAIYKMALKVVLIHNHPSGKLQPSEMDIDMTDRLLKSGALLGIEVVDHLIITEEGYLSLADDGILDMLAKNGRYELVEKEKEELREWKIKTERERADKEARMAIGKKLKALGHDKDAIKQITGLRITDIKKL